MTILALGLNHTTAPVAIRERVTFGPDIVVGALRNLCEIPGVAEAVILSTCNRTEVYCSASEEQIEQVREVLQGQDWQPVVQVRETGEEVQIFMKAEGARMHGLTVMAVDGEEAVFINVLGEINPDQLDKVMKQFDVDVDLEAGDEA